MTNRKDNKKIKQQTLVKTRIVHIEKIITKSTSHQIKPKKQIKLYFIKKDMGPVPDSTL